MKDIIIAIDGYSACGKSTFAKAISAKLGYTFIDSGAMYRAVTLYALRNNLINEDGAVKIDELIEHLPNINVRQAYNKESGKNETFLNNENVEDEIRLNKVSDSVSRISEIAEVRERMVALQQVMGKMKSIVMDGRDIGTTVFPDAELKIFMTADTKVRALRRYNELLGKGVSTTLEEVEKNLKERDYIDENRVVSPLRRAADALILDNSNLTLEQEMEWVVGIIEERRTA
jgi:cytidylate kinase